MPAKKAVRPVARPPRKAPVKKERPVESEPTLTAEEVAQNKTLGEMVSQQVMGAAAKPRPRAQTPEEIDAAIRAGIPSEVAPVARATPRDQADQTLAALVDVQKSSPTQKSAAAAHLPPPKKGETALQYQERLADILTTAEDTKRKEILKARRLGKPKGEIPVYNVFIPTRKDASEPPPGAQLKEGWKQTWARRTDFRGEPDPSLSRVQELRDWGYEVVLDADGKPVQQRLGVLMQGPPEQRAARVAHLTPVGARKPNHYEDEVRTFVENTNRAYGKGVVGVVSEGGREAG